MTLPNRWASQFAWLAVWVVAALALGAWFGGMGWWLAGALSLYAARLLRRLYLLDRVWGGNVYVEERTVDVHIRRLRKTLEPFGCQDLVQTVRGAGYRFSTTPAE